MTAKRHNGARGDATADRYLDAARECVLAVGVRRTSLTDVARRAGVSRMTLYRRWPDMDALVADLMTREWLAVADGAFSRASAQAPDGPAPARLARAVVEVVTAFGDNPLFVKIVDVDPDLLLPYLLQRRGRSQEAILDLLTEVLDKGRHEGAVRDVEPSLLARMVLLTAQGFALSAPTMADVVSLDQLRAELTVQLERYLTP